MGAKSQLTVVHFTVHQFLMAMQYKIQGKLHITSNLNRHITGSDSGGYQFLDNVVESSLGFWRAIVNNQKKFSKF